MHCFEAYSDNAKITLADVQKDSSAIIIRWELAAEPVAWEDRQDQPLFHSNLLGLPRKYHYLYWKQGCDPQCPRILASQSGG